MKSLSWRSCACSLACRRARGCGHWLRQCGLVRLHKRPASRESQATIINRLPSILAFRSILEIAVAPAFSPTAPRSATFRTALRPPATFARRRRLARTPTNPVPTAPIAPVAGRPDQSGWTRVVPRWPQLVAELLGHIHETSLCVGAAAYHFVPLQTASTIVANFVLSDRVQPTAKGITTIVVVKIDQLAGHGAEHFLCHIAGVLGLQAGQSAPAVNPPAVQVNHSPPGVRVVISRRLQQRRRRPTGRALMQIQRHSASRSFGPGDVPWDGWGPVHSAPRFVRLQETPNR